MSKLVKIIAAAVLIVVGVVTGNFQLILDGVLLLGSALLTPGNKQQARQAETTSLQLGEVPRQAVFGEALIGGSLEDAFNYGGQYGTDWEVLPIVLADHYCEELIGFYANDQFVAFTGNGMVPGYNNQLSVTFYPGTEGQTADPTLTGHGDWTSADRLTGLCYVVVAYKADDEKNKNPIWTAGRPRFSWLLKGKRCYDPRKDSTVAGGSGAHRWADPSTWEWTDNPIVIRYNWVRGVYACDRVGQPDMLLVGRGLSAIEAPPENVAWRANICDEMVALAAGGSEKRYRFNGLIKADEVYLQTEERFAAACAGVIKSPEGSVEVDPGHAVTPSFFITDADFVTKKKRTFAAFRSKADTQWVNTIIPRYVEPNQKWQDHAAPIRRVYADVIADGGPREATLSLPDVTSGTQAQRCGEIARRMGRLKRTGGGTFGPLYIGVEEGDWGVLTSTRLTKGLPVGVRAESMLLDQSWQNSLQLREMVASVFDWSTADEIAEGAVATANPVPVFGGAPDVAEWAVAGGVVAGENGAVLPAIFLTGGALDPYATSLIVEYRTVTVDLYETGLPVLTVTGGLTLAEADPGPWIAETPMSPATTAYTLRGLAAGQFYQVAVSYLVRGTVGDRLILGPAQAGAMAVARTCYVIVGYDGAIPLSSDGTNIYVTAFDAVLDDARPISFPAATVAGLTNSTKYGVFWNLTAGAYEAELSPALIRKASSDYVFLVWQATSNGAGTYPSSPPDPPGFGGYGPREALP
ncbi:phage tail protein [Sphingomonas sp. RT2P30]|uniref:phage tail protein n=1 Tax=Parasphingomonas halimpatiens TaxID=3096162 RepID=UPI002FC68DE4